MTRSSTSESKGSSLQLRWKQGWEFPVTLVDDPSLFEDVDNVWGSIQGRSSHPTANSNTVIYEWINRSYEQVVSDKNDDLHGLPALESFKDKNI